MFLQNIRTFGSYTLLHSRRKPPYYMQLDNINVCSALGMFCSKQKVKQSHYRPGQDWRVQER